AAAPAGPLEEKDPAERAPRDASRASEPEHLGDVVLARREPERPQQPTQARVVTVLERIVGVVLRDDAAVPDEGPAHMRRRGRIVPNGRLPRVDRLVAGTRQ